MTEQTSNIVTRTKRVNLISDLPTEDNGYTLTVSAEVIGTNETVTFSEQTPVVSEFWAKALIAGIKERFATVIAGANGETSAIVERLIKEVEALKAGNYATRGGRGSVKTDFINTVVAMAFVELFGNVKVNEDNFDSVMANTEALQAANAKYEALTKEEKLAAVKEFAKVASGISYFKAASED